MFKKQLRDFLKDMGYGDLIDEETLDTLVRQLLQILDMGMAQNAITIKTGCLLHQFALANQDEVRDLLIKQIREGKPLPVKFEIRAGAICLYLDEEGMCKVINSRCGYEDQLYGCEVVKSSIDIDLDQWK